MQEFPSCFQYEARQSVTGVHLKLSGSFVSADFSKLSKLINDVYCAGQRLFLDVRALAVESALCREAFKKCIAHLPPKQVVFKGKQGLELGLTGNRLLIMKDSPCKCNGACKSCACDMRVKNRNEVHTFHLEKQRSLKKIA